VAATYCKETWFGRTGAGSKDGKRRYSRIFQVFTDHPQDGPWVASSHPDIPRLHFPYITPNEYDLLAICVDVAPKQNEESPEIWEVNCSFETPDAITMGESAPGPSQGTSPGGQSPPPTDDPPKVSYNANRFTEPVDKDKDGDPIVNTAGDRITGLVKDASRPILRIVRKLRTFDADQFDTYANTVNDAPWKGREARTYKCEPITADRDQRAGVFFWLATFSFSYNEDTWDYRYYNAGFNELRGGIKRLIKDAHGQTYSEPSFLKLNGEELAVGGTPVLFQKRVYQEKNFSLLPV
jgi:hypothetical protein